MFSTYVVLTKQYGLDIGRVLLSILSWQDGPISLPWASKSEWKIYFISPMGPASYNVCNKWSCSGAFSRHFSWINSDSWWFTIRHHSNFWNKLIKIKSILGSTQHIHEYESHLHSNEHCLSSGENKACTGLKMYHLYDTGAVLYCQLTSHWELVIVLVLTKLNRALHCRDCFHIHFIKPQFTNMIFIYPQSSTNLF